MNENRESSETTAVQPNDGTCCRHYRRTHVLFAGGFSFANFLMDVLTLFAFVIWFWLAISVCGDLFRREDIFRLG